MLTVARVVSRQEAAASPAFALPAVAPRVSLAWLWPQERRRPSLDTPRRRASRCLASHQYWWRRKESACFAPKCPGWLRTRFRARSGPAHRSSFARHDRILPLAPHSRLPGIRPVSVGVAAPWFRLRAANALAHP